MSFRSESGWCHLHGSERTISYSCCCSYWKMKTTINGSEYGGFKSQLSCHFLLHPDVAVGMPGSHCGRQLCEFIPSSSEKEGRSRPGGGPSQAKDPSVCLIKCHIQAQSDNCRPPVGDQGGKENYHAFSIICGFCTCTGRIA